MMALIPIAQHADDLVDLLHTTYGQNQAKLLFSLTDDKPLVLRHILTQISTA